MTNQTAIRWSGLVLVLGGLIGAVSTFFRPSGDASSIALQPQWIPVHTLFVAANLFITFGLVGLYMRQAEEIGKVGFVAFVLAFFATALSIVVAAIEAYVYPAIAAAPNAPQSIGVFASPTGPLAAVDIFNWVFVAFYEPGYILLSILTLRAGVLPRWAAWLLLIGSVASNAAFLGPGAALITLLGYEAFCIGLAWLGYAVWAERPARVIEAQPVT